MKQRAEQEAETRRRIIEAAVDLHRQRGIVSSKPVEIAAGARVSLGTYYKHFPTLGGLVTACTALVRDLIPPPALSSIEELPPDTGVRIPVMVAGLFGYYEIRESFLYVGRTEEKFVPELGPAVKKQRETRDAFVRAALSPSGVDLQTSAVVSALVDFWSWRSLRREAGLAQEEAIRNVAEAVGRIVGDAKAR